ncbi:MAG: hypothetical protein NTZ09_14725 [Candidatus Hydrogenedentes bacterium]|nr:hypothetical protein [Candidatus Hydrogenedentota bacterium]
MQALMLLVAGLSVAPVSGSLLPVQWGPRLDGGPIHVAFIAPAFTTRDIDEVGLRLEIKPLTVKVWSSNQLAGPGQSDDQILQDIRDALAKDSDVLVIGNINLRMLPEDILETIKSRVTDGKGLVLANHRDGVPETLAKFLQAKEPAESSADITRGVGESMTTEWPSNLEFVSAGTAGKGRIVELDYAGDKPYCHFLLPGLTDPLRARPEYMDVYLSLVCRAIRWAAGRRPAVAVAAVEDASPAGPTDDQIPPGMPEEYIQQIKDGVARPLFKPYLIRLTGPADRPYRVYAQVRESSRQLRAGYPDLPPLKKGQSSYLLEIPLGPGRYFLDLWFYDKKQVVEWHTANITVTGWPEITEVNWSKGNLLPNDRLLISLDVRPQLNRPRGCTVYARATDALGRMVAENVAPVAADGGPVQVPLNFADLLTNFVKVEVFAADVEGRPLSAWDLDHATYSHIYMPVRLARAPVCSLTVEAPAVAEYNARTWLRTLAGAGVDSVYTASSEDARFHLAEMNLRPVPDLLEMVQQNTGAAETTDPLRETVPAYWAAGTTAYLLGTASEFGPSLESGRESVRAIDGEALVGVRISGEPGAALDWPGLASGLDFLAAPDDGPGLYKLRSYRPPGSVAELVVDGNVSGWHAWRQAMFQMQGVWLRNTFAGAADPSSPNGIGADGRLTAGFLDLADAVAELRSGVGFLLAHSARKPEIAIVEAGPGSEQAESTLASLLESRAYEFDFVTADAVKSGALSRYKMVLMPTAEPGKELESRLKEFEGSGGKVGTVPVEGVSAIDLGGIEPAVIISGSPENAGVEAHTFTFGDAKLFAFLGSPDIKKKTQKFTFSQAAPGHVYDVRRGKYLGRSKKVSVVAPRGGAAVYASLPYRVDGVEVTTLGTDVLRAGRPV